MKHLKKKIAILLCFVMCVAMLPTWVLAEEAEPEVAEAAEELLTEAPAEETVIPEEETPAVDDAGDPVSEDPYAEEEASAEVSAEEAEPEEPTQEEVFEEETATEEPDSETSEEEAEAPAEESSADEETEQLTAEEPETEDPSVLEGTDLEEMELSADEDTVPAGFENAQTIINGETKTAEIREAGETVYFKFVPDTTETFYFIATYTDYFITSSSLYSAQGEVLAFSVNDIENGGFKIEHHLEAEKTYYFSVKFDWGYEYDTGSFPVRLISESLMKQELLETIQNAPVIHCSEEMTIDYKKDGQEEYFQFIPDETDTYCLTVVMGNQGSEGCLYDAEGNVLATGTVDSTGSYKLTYPLEAGKRYCYYLKLRYIEIGQHQMTLLNEAQQMAAWQEMVQNAQVIHYGEKLSVKGYNEEFLYFRFTPETDDIYFFKSNWYAAYLFDANGNEINNMNYYWNQAMEEYWFELKGGETYYYGIKGYSYGQGDGTVTISLMISNQASQADALKKAAMIQLGQTVVLNVGDTQYLAFTPDATEEYSVLIAFNKGKKLSGRLYDGNTAMLGNEGSQTGSIVLSYHLSDGEPYYIALESLEDVGEVSIQITSNSSNQAALENAIPFSVGETVSIPAGKTSYYKLTWVDNDYYYFYTKNKANAITVTVFEESGAVHGNKHLKCQENQIDYLNWSDYTWSWGSEEASLYYAVTYSGCEDEELQLTALRRQDILDLMELKSADGNTYYVVPKGETVNLAVSVSPEWLGANYTSRWTSFTTWTEEDTIGVTYYNWGNPIQPLTTKPVNENRRYEFQLLVDYVYDYDKPKSLSFYVDYEREEGYTGDQITWEISEDGTTLTLNGSGEMWDYFGENGFLPPWSNQVSGITKVVVSEGITSIGSYAFQNMTNLTEASIPSTVTHIDSDAFANCTSLNTVKLPASLREIRRYAFYGSGLESVVLPNGMISIGQSVFMGCKALTTALIPASITTVGEAAFEGSGLQTAYYIGTQEQWSEVEVGKENMTLLGKLVFGHEHTSGDAVRENEAAATCKAEGHYDEVVYCSICHEELSRETKTVEKLEHTPGEAVRENEVAATCKAEGRYDEVVYCTVCNEELSRETKTVEKLAHTAGEAVRENEVAATCTETGSYDEVVYCTVCNEELSREAKTVEALGHDYVDGICTRCGEREPGKIEFEDVADPTVYYYNPVYWAAANGITSGTSATTFSPGKSCTRGQIVTFLWKAMGSPEPSTADNPFTDVKESDYFYKPVLWAKEKGVTSGKTATTFAPGAPCTRGQIVTFLWKAMGSPEPSSTSNPFSDVKTDDYFFKPVLWAKENGITSGTSPTTFGPGNTCTRGQAMTFLWIASGKP